MIADYRDSDGNWSFNVSVPVEVQDGAIFATGHIGCGQFEIDRADDGRVNLRLGGSWKYVVTVAELAKAGFELPASQNA